MVTNSVITTLGLILVIVLAAALPAGTATDLGNVLDSIERDFKNGTLTLDDKVILQITAIKNPDDLPSEYQSLALGGAGVPPRGASMIFRDIRLAFDDLAPSTQEFFLAATARVEAEFTYDSPGGGFKLHYDTNTTTTDNFVPAADDDSSGVPDFIEKCAAYCDTVYDAHVQLGYLLPPSDNGLGGDNKQDVYFEDNGVYGYSIPEGAGPMPWNDFYSYIVLNSDFLDSNFATNMDPEGDQWGRAKVTIAHEYHHCVQYAYDASEGAWFMELDAVHMEELIFDETNDCYQYLGSYFYYPQRSLMENSSHYYSCFIWGLYLAQKFDTSLMRAVWEGSTSPVISVFGAMSDTLMGRYGWTQDSAFADFVLWNYCTAERDDGLHHEEAANYPAVTVGQAHSSYPVSVHTCPGNPAGYGSSYVSFYPDGTLGTLHLLFNGSDSFDWVAYIIKSTSENEHEFEQITLNPSNSVGEIAVLHFEDYYRVTLVGANVSEFTGGGPYTYSASVQPPYAAACSLLTSTTQIYSGAPRECSLLVVNPSPLLDIYNIIYWDDNGWLPCDTIDKSMPAGFDTVFAIVAQPPPGTPLGTSSCLHFMVESWGDPGVTASDSVTAEAIMLYGDCDFTGVQDISDLIYLVDFAFANGPDPLPTRESANFDCEDDVDISDLVAMVEYMFQGGPASPCNPY